MSTRLLITGICGFLRCHLARRLLETHENLPMVASTRSRVELSLNTITLGRTRIELSLNTIILGRTCPRTPIS